MSAPLPDHYRVLQVDPAANSLVILAAYRVLARIFHPDVCGDEDEMKRINAAWEVLGDRARRAAYDAERADRHLAPVAREHAPRGAATRGAATHAAATHAPASHASSAWPSRHADPFPDATAAGPEGAGPPRGIPFGPVLTFGRYAGWSLGQVARIDPAYMEWLRHAPAGRGLWSEIDAVVRSAGLPGVDRRRYDIDRRGRNLAGLPLRA